MLNIELPYDSAVPFLGMYSKEMKSVCQDNIRTPMFVTVLFMVVPAQNQLQCPLMEE